MNKYERLFEDVLQATRDGGISWRQLKRFENSDLILHPHLVFRQYAAKMQRGDDLYTILLIEKKFEDPEADIPIDKYSPELLFLADGELVTTITDTIVDRKTFFRLVDLVERRSDKAKKLFDA